MSISAQSWASVPARAGVDLDERRERVLVVRELERELLVGAPTAPIVASALSASALDLLARAQELAEDLELFLPLLESPCRPRGRARRASACGASPEPRARSFQKPGSPVVRSSSSFSFAALRTSKIAAEGAHGRRELEQPLDTFFVARSRGLHSPGGRGVYARGPPRASGAGEPERGGYRRGGPRRKPREPRRRAADRGRRRPRDGERHRERALPVRTDRHEDASRPRPPRR